MTYRKPWQEPNPRQAAGKSPRKLTAAQRAEARARARKAGRKYPNLVDNMAVLRKTRKEASTAEPRKSKPTTRAAGKRR